MKNTGFSEITTERLYYNGSDPWYMEIAITGRCNFSCKYCNRFNNDIDLAKLSSFIQNNQFKHIQITGGEPTVHNQFFEIMNLCRNKTKKLGLSTNGTFGIDNYLKSQADMFSVSLDDYDMDILKNRGYNSPEKIVDTIKQLVKYKYVNIGLVIDSLNIDRIESIVDFILSLGVNDIKLSTSTKDQLIPKFKKDYIKYPILNYRVQNFKDGKQMRGNACKKCYIASSDVTIVGDSHYPCLTYFREKGTAIGKVNNDLMKDRIVWMNEHDCSKDDICQKYCMDFKCEFNRARTEIVCQSNKSL